MARFSLQIILFVISVIFSHTAGKTQRLCGNHLAEALKLVCKGTYKSRTAREAMLTRQERDVNSGSVVHECCKNRCDLSTLLGYCGTLPPSNDDGNSLMSTLFSLKPAVQEISGSKISPQSLPVADAPAAPAPGRPRNGRYQDTINQLGNSFDSSPLVDTRFAEYDNGMPYRQR